MSPQKNQIEDAKDIFILNEIFLSALHAGFRVRGRYSRIYGESATGKNKDALKKCLKKDIESIAEKYRRNQDIKQYYIDVKSLSGMIEKDYSKILNKGEFRVGISQKILGLYLKYLWIYSRIPTPPACPLDRKIIEVLGFADTWTTLNRMEDLKRILNKAHSQAKGEKLSIAEWELVEWNRLKPS